MTRKASIELFWASLKGERFMEIKVSAAVFTDPDQAEAYADAILEAAARMRQNKTDHPTEA